jgi:tetratricopeptide (TPR) repeat protein
MQWLDEEWGWQTILDFLKAYGRGVSDAKVFEEVLKIDNQKAEHLFRKWLEKNVMARIPLPAQVPGKLDRVEALAFALEKGEVFRVLEAVSPEAAPKIRLYRALALEELGESDKALDIYRALEGQLTGDFLYHFHYGKNLFEIGKDPEAEGHLLKAQAIYPRWVKVNDHPYYFLYQIYKRQGRKDKARDILWRYPRVQQKEQRARFWLYREFRAQKNFEKADLLLEEILAIHPFHMEALLWQADRAKREGKLPLQADCYRRLFDLARMADLVDQESLFNDQERLDFLSRAVEPWLEAVTEDSRKDVARRIALFFPDHPRIQKILN